MDAFGAMLVGFEYPKLSFRNEITVQPISSNSGIMSTVIGMGAKELQYLRSYQSNPLGLWNDTSVTSNTADQFSLQDGIEQLLKNTTVNLMTAYMLQ